VRRNTLVIDGAIAAAVAIAILIISPGLAVAGMIAIVVLVVCAISLVLDVRRGRRPRAR
jgi:hypothetical membrane protein